MVSSSEETHDLYWVDENISLKEFKKAIGSKLVWKYRLQFYPCLEDFIEAQNQSRQTAGFTPEDIALIEGMKASVR
jgi:hypothetical protein